MTKKWRRCPLTRQLVVWIALWQQCTNDAWMILSAGGSSRRRHHAGVVRHCHYLYTCCHDEADQEDWEEIARSISANTLQSVLGFSSRGSDLNVTTAEKALQRALRSSLPSDDCCTPDVRRWLRHRIKELVLGTSIFRLRHEYVWNTTTTTTNTKSMTNEGGQTPNNKTQRNNIRDLVDLHAAFQLTQTRTPDDTSSSSSSSFSWPSDPLERISVQYSLPRFLVQLWLDQYGCYNVTIAICQACNQPGPITLRRNKIECASELELIQRLKQEGVKVKPLANVVQSINERNACWQPPSGCLRVKARPPNRSIWSLDSWRDGCFEVQDVGSQLVVKAVEARFGETVIDYCAGNGGKTLALASELYLPRADATTTTSCSHVIAHDVVPERLAQLQGSLGRAGLLDCASVRVLTTANADQDLPDDMADVVLVDAPCSSCGVLRRRPSQRWMISEKDICKTLPNLQLSILKSAARLVKPGGRLVYATCSISEWENQRVVDAWEACAEFETYETWDFGSDWPRQVDLGLPNHCRQLLPHIHDSDGFFMARWKRSTY